MERNLLITRRSLIRSKLISSLLNRTIVGKVPGGRCRANENLNGSIRQYFPKQCNFTQVEKTEINQVVNILNTRPRKRFGYKTPNEVFAEILNENLSVAFIT